MAAVLDGIILVAFVDRHLAKSSGLRATAAAFGAAGGVLILGIVFATWRWAIGVGSCAFLIVGFSVALAVAAGIVAAILVHRAERRSEHAGPERVEHPLPSAWADF
ncbi:hypothetical protein [Cryobacterium sp. Y11]|uniref:hypothetical protein n=1 Tax=Cryobacterium sp. Y11 TaxID=2045016 RepID=UPI000CE56AF5|nr:hypothetical protein [Cryobacterium sp. Y11]